MSKALRYQISNWNQITDCLSNNSRNLYLDVTKILDRNRLRGLRIQVNHPNYGVLFCAFTDASGELVSDYDETGMPISFMTTEEILKQLEKFGFIIKYDVKSNLPNNEISLLSQLYNLGYDKITKVVVRKYSTRDYSYYNEPQIIVMKSKNNLDILEFGCPVSDKTFKDKLAANTIMNLSHEENMRWDWLTYMANISDILDENIDPVDEFETDTEVEEEPINEDPGFTPYEDPEFTPYEDPEDVTTESEEPREDEP